MYTHCFLLVRIITKQQNETFGVYGSTPCLSDVRARDASRITIHLYSTFNEYDLKLKFMQLSIKTTDHIGRVGKTIIRNVSYTHACDTNRAFHRPKFNLASSLSEYVSMGGGVP